MIKEKEVSVFIPAYNEEEIIENNIQRIYDYLKNEFKYFELIIVDDSSKDKTSEIARKLSQETNIQYARFENCPSRRENLAVSLKRAKYDIVVFMDLDLATDLSYLKDLINNIQNGNDISIGSRYKGIKPKRELYRLIISKVYNLFMRIYFGSNILDHQCGFKAFKKEVLLELIEEMGYDTDLTRGWFWDAELLIRAQKKGYRISEMPIKWQFGKKSTFNMQRELKMLGYVLKLRWKL